MARLTDKEIADVRDALTSLYDVRDDYSGRGMYRETCIAVDLDGDADLWRMALDLVDALTDAGYSAGDVPDLLRRLGPPVTDAMGLGIVAYWPLLTTKKAA